MSSVVTKATFRTFLRYQIPRCVLLSLGSFRSLATLRRQKNFWSFSVCCQPSHISVTRCNRLSLDSYLSNIYIAPFCALGCYSLTPDVFSCVHHVGILLEPCHSCFRRGTYLVQPANADETTSTIWRRPVGGSRRWPGQATQKSSSAYNCL
jgi:hypothetical protein